MLADIQNRPCWARNIPPPSTPKRYDPNQLPFDPADILGDVDNDDPDEI